jgi:hypothetical protein
MIFSPASFKSTSHLINNSKFRNRFSSPIMEVFSVTNHYFLGYSSPIRPVNNFPKRELTVIFHFQHKPLADAYLRSKSNTKSQPLFYYTKEEAALRKTKHKVALSKIIPLANEPGILAYTPIYPQQPRNGRKASAPNSANPSTSYRIYQSPHIPLRLIMAGKILSLRSCISILSVGGKIQPIIPTSIIGRQVLDE